MTTQIDVDAKAMILAYMTGGPAADEAYDALMEQAKAEPEEYIKSLVCLAIEILKHWSVVDRQHRSPEVLLSEEIGANLAH